MKNALLCVFLLGVFYSAHSKGLKVEFTWSRLSYALPPVDGKKDFGEAPSKDAIIFPTHCSDYENKKLKPEDYIYENNIPMGANRWKDKLFITVPRRRFGIPSTLNYIRLNTTERHNVPLIPYPDFATNRMRLSPNREEDCLSFGSIYRVTVDPCHRLWMVDTGIVEDPNNRTRIGPQRLIIIDLNTDKVIKVYNFKGSDLTPTTTLALVTVDVNKEDCGNAYGYFPDFLGSGLVVYSLKLDDSWRIRHQFFSKEPGGDDFTVSGIKFQWKDGIFSGGITDILPDGYRNYIFHAMAGTHEYSVSTKILRNRYFATRPSHGDDFKDLGNKGKGWQTSASDLHKNTGILFWSLVNQNAIGCWNTNTTFEKPNFDIVQKDDNHLIYPSDLKISEDNIIVLTNKMPVFVYSKLNYDEVNFRVWINDIDDAVRGTACEK